MTTLATLLTQMNEDYLRDPNYRIWNQNSQTRAIQKAYTQVQSDLEREQPENEINQSITAVVGTQAYALASDFVRISLVRFNGDVLRQKSQKSIKMQYETMQQWTPDSYYLYGGQIYMHPIPNVWGTIDVDYYGKATEITSIQASTLPTDFNDAICLFASAKLMKWVWKWDLWAQFMADYAAEILKLRSQFWLNDENTAWKDGTQAQMVSEKGIGYNE